MCLLPGATKHKFAICRLIQTSHIKGVIDLLFPEFLAASNTTTFLRMASGMITPSVFLSLVCLVAVVLASDGDESDGCSGTANYVMSFYGLWKRDRHPNTSLPNGAHFSPLVGCSHGSGYVMWHPCAKASAGVELVAETGETGTLESEIAAQITAKKAWKLILPGGPQLDPEAIKTGIDVEVTASFSKVSIITMLAPSPDWFIGIDSRDMCDNGKWRESMNVTMLAPYDAGTENGTAFSTNNTATNPPDKISKITNNTAGAFNGPNPIPSLGEFRFVKTDGPAEPTESSVGKASFNFAVFTSAALILALLF